MQYHDVMIALAYAEHQRNRRSPHLSAAQERRRQVTTERRRARPQLSVATTRVRRTASRVPARDAA